MTAANTDATFVPFAGGMAYSGTMEVIMRTVLADARVLKDPEFVIAVNDLADSSVNFVLRPWCRAADYWDLKWALTRNIKGALDASGVSIPSPQRDIHMIQAG